MMDASGSFIEIREIPFSYFGSWLNVSPVIGQHVYADDLHLVSHQNGQHAVLRMRPEGTAAESGVDIHTDPARLSWVAGVHRIDAVFESADTLRVRGAGLGLTLSAANSTLTSFTGTYLFRDPRDGSFVFVVYETGLRYRVTVVTGIVARAEGLQQLGVADRSLTLGSQPWEIAIEEFTSARASYIATESFEHIVECSGTAFTAFVDAVAPWRSNLTPAVEAACYVLWTSTVSPLGFMRRPSVLMSKHWMDKLWSWDHCFNALALADGLPELAIDQFLAPFDYQDESGAIPDSISHSEILRNFVKPPIHGWTFRQLEALLGDRLDAALKHEIYRVLSAWTRFWLDSRRVPGHTLAHYQHGNDSGWDNATSFDRGRLIETPELAAFLIIQARVCASLSAELGDGQTATWTRAADEIRDALFDQLWTGTRFCVQSAHHDASWTSDSLLELVVILLGDELTSDMTTALASGIDAHMTEWGPATELPMSPKYESDGYWRGPIWAPSTLLIEDGLRRAGCTELADEVSARFRRLCERSGFAENFDAITGAGLRDRAYTWTAACYLVLARRAAHDPNTPKANVQS